MDRETDRNSVSHSSVFFPLTCSGQLFTASVWFCSGYLAPEYALSGQYSVKTDTFSFGVLMLEIISGKKNRSFFHVDHNTNLIGHVSSNNQYIYLLPHSVSTLNIL